MNFKYEVLEFKRNDGELKDLLNNVGAKGWQVVDVKDFVSRIRVIVMKEED